QGFSDLGDNRARRDVPCAAVVTVVGHWLCHSYWTLGGSCGVGSVLHPVGMAGLGSVDIPASGLHRPTVLGVKAGKGDEPWIARASPTHNGTRSPSFCPANPVTRAGLGRTTAGSSKPCCGSLAPARRGAIFRRRSAIGTRCSSASADGRQRACLSACSRRYGTTRTLNMSSWTAPSVGSIRRPLAQKGD